MKLARYIAKRIVRLVLTLFIISTIIFFVVRVIPGDPALIIGGIESSESDIQAIRTRFGFWTIDDFR